MTDIIVIPDTQVIPNCPLEHIFALGNYLEKHKPTDIVVLGDWFDMHSLASYDIGKKAGEGLKYQDDIDCGICALDVLFSSINVNNLLRKLNKKKIYKPNKYFLIGNHEQRIQRHVNTYPYLDGKLSYKDFNLSLFGFKVFDFLDILDIEGIKFSHYFLNPDSVSRKLFTSSIDTQVKNLGFSCISGHLPGLQISQPRYTADNRILRGIQAGSFYLHDFPYQNPPQGNNYWRGALHLHDVEDGNFRLEELEINWLIRNYS